MNEETPTHPLTPKPDPVIFDKKPIVASETEVPASIESTNTEMTSSEKFKEYVKKHKKLVIALSILGLALLIAIILIILSYKPTGNLNQNIVSEPVVETAKPVILSKECNAENQNITVNVPDDWTCAKNNDSNASIKDLLITNTDISINFPLDVQPALGCGLNTSNCASEIIYSSNKIDALKLYRVNGKVDVLSANILLGTKSYVVNIRIKDKSQTELTPDQKNLIIKILEAVEINTGFVTTKELSFTVDPVVVGPVSGTKSFVGNITVDSDTTLIQKDSNTASIAKGNTSLNIGSYYEVSGPNQFFNEELVGNSPTLSNIYRVSMEVGDGTAVFYVPAKMMKFTDAECIPASYPAASPGLHAPCGLPTVDPYPYFLRCSSTNGNPDFSFCDTIAKNLSFTLKDN